MAPDDIATRNAPSIEALDGEGLALSALGGGAAAAASALVELDNTQDGANHVHTVVRDPDGDFGADLLATHHRDGHAEGQNR